MRKYYNRKTVVDGIEFDSIREANRYSELKLMEKAGLIRGLNLQPRYELQPAFTKNGKHWRKIEYVADFEYIENGKVIVEDAKGFKTDVYKLKRKMFEYKYPDVTIKEV